MRTHFPTRFSDADLRAYDQQVERREQALADFVQTGEQAHLDVLAEVDAWLLEQAKPDIFDDGDERNVLVGQRRAYGQLFAALADHGFARAQDLPLYDFHSAIDYVSEKNQPAGVAGGAYDAYPYLNQDS